MGYRTISDENILKKGEEMEIAGVKTNIETTEQYEALIRRMMGWFVALEYPRWQIKNMKVVENEK